MNPVKLLIPFEVLLGLVICVLTAIILLFGAIFSVGTAWRYLKIKTM